MKFLKLAVAVITLFLTTSVNAALITDSSLNYSTDTVSGLDWLKLSETHGPISYNDAETYYSTGYSRGWRYATNDEVMTIFGLFFPDFTPDGPSGLMQVPINDSNVLAWIDFFGNEEGSPDIASSWGFYKNESNILRMIGASNRYLYDSFASITGPDYTRVYSPDFGEPFAGVMLVRNTASVPETASLALFALGLLGIFGVVRRKS